MKTVNMTVVKMVVSKDKHSVYWRDELMVSKRAASMDTKKAVRKVEKMVYRLVEWRAVYLVS